MRHRKKTLKLNRTPAHLRAVLANAVSSLIRRERVQMTEKHAGAVCSLAERMVTLAKRGDLHSRRIAQSRIRDRAAVAKLFKDLGPRYAKRNGGYTRIIKTIVRKGDGASLAICELVDTAVPVKVRKKKKEEGKKTKG